jgi:RNA polymerase sigma-70 factor (ECF subfamily)
MGAVAALRRGDISGLEPLVRRYQAAALRLAVALTGNRDMAEDAVSDAFIAAHRYIGSFDPARPFEPWFFQILVNEVRRLLRREQRQRRSRQAWAEAPCREEPLPEEEVVRTELAVLVQDAIRQLPIKQREVLVLTYYLDMDTATVAHIQSVPVGTVKWRLYQGRRRLQAALSPHGDRAGSLDTEVLFHEPRT